MTGQVFETIFRFMSNIKQYRTIKPTKLNKNYVEKEDNNKHIQKSFSNFINSPLVRF